MVKSLHKHSGRLLGRAHIVLTGQVPSRLTVSINGKQHEFPVIKTKFQKEARIDISRLIEDGKNTVVFILLFSYKYLCGTG